MRSLHFEEVADIARKVSRLAPPRVRFFSKKQFDTSSFRYAMLYRAMVHESSAITEDDIARSICSENARSSTYRVLRSKLKDMLLNALFVLDLKSAGHKEFSQAKYRNNKDLFLARTLLHLGARRAGIRIARPALVEAEYYELWENAILFASMLREHATLLGKKRQQLSYAKKYREMLERYTADEDLKQREEAIEIHFAVSGSEKPELLPIAQANADHARMLASQFGLFGLSMRAIRLQTYASQLAEDYESTLVVCEEASSLFERFPHLINQVIRLEFALRRILCLRSLRQFDQGFQACAECEGIISEGIPSWFDLQSEKFLLLLHLGQHTQAADLLENVRGHSGFKVVVETKRMRWGLYRLYALYATGKLAPSDIRHFVRDAPDYTKDKQGYNVAILILQILLLLEANDTVRLHERVQALTLYRKRYFSGPMKEQSVAFFRLVILLSECDLDYPEILRRSKRWVPRLQALPNNFAGDIQILPFGWMWERMMLAVKRNWEKRQLEEKLLREAEARRCSGAVPGP